MLFAMLGSVETGVIFAVLALGVYLSFRVLNIPDLTVEGSFTTGGAVAASMIAGGSSPLLATGAAMCAGITVGCVTGALHTKGKINALLAGILTMIALYSINLRVMGKANVPLLTEETVITQIQDRMNWLPEGSALLVALLAGIAAVKLVLDRFLHSEYGLVLRATGDNERMIRSFAADTDRAKIVGLGLSNGMVALSGALMAQYQGFADVSMGIGMIVIGLASVIIGEAVFGHTTISRATLAVIGGAILFRLIVALALRAGLEPSDLKLITALIVMAALILPKVWTQRKVARWATK